MSQENVEILRRASAAFESTGDQEGLLELCAEDIVWDVSRSDFPDKGIYHGLEGVREWMRGLDDAFEGLLWEFEGITDLGEERVLVATRVTGRGLFSKIGIDYRFVQVNTFRDGRVVRMDRYGDRAEALKAAGLAE
jgi:ketosteroid isomerase-like protein